MPITIKEIRVVTTVTRDRAAEKPPGDQMLQELKREILAEIRRNDKRNGRKKNER